MMGEQNGRAKRKRDGTEFEAHRWIDFPSCRLVTESTVYSGKLQLFHYLPNDATVYERAVQPDVCTHREREREERKRHSKAEDRIDVGYFYDRDSMKRSAGTIFHGFRGK